MPQPSQKVLLALIYLALATGTLLVYWQVRGFEFVSYDDDIYVHQNPHVVAGMTVDGIAWAFTTGHAAFWHPLTWLSLMLDRTMFGLDAGWFHLTNLFLHLAATLLLFALFRMMTGQVWPSVFVAAAFAIHPMHVESVAWVAERKDVLSTFFMMLTLIAWVRYVRRPSAWLYAAALSLFVLGLMAKPMLITLPFVMLLLDVWPLERFGFRQASGEPAGRTKVSRLLLEKVPFFLVAVLFAVITFLVQQKAGAMQEATATPMMARIANAVISYSTYIGKMFWPHGLAAYYPLRTVPTWQVVLYSLFLAAVTVWTIRSWRSRRYLLVGWLWFIGTLIPVIGLVRFTGSSYADRFTYVPYIGLFIMVAWGFGELFAAWAMPKSVRGAMMGAALVAMGLCAHRQAGFWHDGIRLFSHAIEVTPGNSFAYRSRGAAFILAGQWEDAIRDCSDALRFNPGDVDALSNRGLAYVNLGRVQEAIADYTEAIRLQHDSAAAYCNRGEAYYRLGRLEDAVSDYNDAIRIDPISAVAFNNRGNAYGRLGRWQDAVADLTRAIELRPDYAEAFNNRGVASGNLGRAQDAIADYTEAIRLKPDNVAAYINRAAAWSALGRLEQARADLEQVIRLDSGYLPAYKSLAVACMRLGHWQEAIAAFRQAVLLNPSDAEACNGLAWLLATAPGVGNLDANEAIRLAGRACQLAGERNPQYAATLAAAYARAGKMADAVSTAEKAIAAAEAANLPKVKAMVQYHLSFYRRGLPYTESPAAPTNRTSD